MNYLYWGVKEFVCIKNRIGQPIFVHFNNKSKEKCRLQRDSNSDRWNWRKANCPLFHHHPTAQKSTFLKLSSEGDLNVDSFPLYGSFTFNGSFSRGLMNAGNLIRPVAVSTSVSSGKRDLARANEKNPSKLARIIQDWKEEIMRGKMTSWPFSHSHFYY